MNLQDIKNKEVFIFDVDGTLYKQAPVRRGMALRLGVYYTLHFWRMRDLLIISRFRKLREIDDYKELTTYQVCEHLGNDMRLSVSRVQSVIQRWMFDEPKDLLCKHAYKNVLSFIEDMKKLNKQVLIYSDYAAEDKIEALGVVADRVYISDMFAGRKPCKEAMDTIVNNYDKSTIVYVGDRDDRDRASAELAGVDYIDTLELQKLLDEE